MVPESRLDMEGGGGRLDTRATQRKRSRRKGNLQAGYGRVGIGFRWGLRNREVARGNRFGAPGLLSSHTHRLLGAYSL